MRTLAWSPEHGTDTAEIMQGLRRIFRAIHEYSRDVQASFGITGPQLWALRILEAGPPMSLGELSARMCLHPGTVSSVVDRLERKGLVRRERSQVDRRLLRLRITPEGETLLARAPEAAQGKLLHGLSRMAPSEVQAIRQAIGHLVCIMEVEDLEVTFFFADD